jgi:hypothetical protein
MTTEAIARDVHAYIANADGTNMQNVALAFNGSDATGYVAKLDDLVSTSIQRWQVLAKSGDVLKLRVDIIINGKDDPSRVARLVVEELEKTHRLAFGVQPPTDAEANKATVASVSGADDKPLNDAVCPHCGNDRCSTTETKCWRCGTTLK